VFTAIQLTEYEEYQGRRREFREGKRGRKNGGERGRIEGVGREDM